MTEYKCAICGKKTDWDSSYGKEEFLVCGDCMNKIGNAIGMSKFGYAFQTIIKIGEIKKEAKTLDKKENV